MKRIIEAKNKKHAEKKQNKNLIQVKPRKDEDFNSQKEYESKPHRDNPTQDVALNQSMMNKITVPKNDPRSQPPPIAA